jgi:phosphoserine phosphatase RsbU/P
MRKTILLFLLFPWPLAAQSALSIAPDQCVWNQGDDTRWAAPDFKDSGWQPAATWQAIATPTPNFWLRCRFHPGQLAAAVDPQLQVSGDLAWQVFANGRFVGASGNVATGTHTVGLVVDYSAPEFSRRDQPVVVALRMTFTPNIDSEQSLPQLSLGDADFQHNAYLSNIYQRTQAQWVTWACYALIASAGLFFLMLYWFDRTQRYVLWVSLTWLSLADLRINEFLLAASVHYPSFAEFFLYSLGQGVPVLVILFYFALNQRPVPRVFRILIGINLYFWLALVVAAFLPLRASMALRWATEVNACMSTIEVVATLAALLSAPVAFWPLRALRGSQIPLAAVCLIWTSMDFTYVFVQFPFLDVNVTGLFLRIQPYRSLAIAVVVVSMTLLLVQRIRSTNRERASLYGEMQAARQIQQLLAPSTINSNAGWSVDVAFLPAREVGGDFYLCRALPGGRQRVLIGDVSGKGTAAAMTATLLIGAAEHREADSPAELLQHLNLVLRDSRVGGFATCLCADLAPDGTIVFANAGHLAPYLNGSELNLENCLPLGIDARAVYLESVFRLSNDAQLTLLTDGVVEARDSSGVLFGFDRAATLSTGSAGSMAQAAEHYGQEDDITVLTLRWLAPAPTRSAIPDLSPA